MDRDSAAAGSTSSPVLNVRPVPTDEEAAAIVAATEALWPRPVAVDTTAAERRSSWRFSGRWWSVPLPVRRDRPWR